MPADLVHALAQAWPPFVLVAGLLLIGVVAAADRLFEAAGTGVARLPGAGAPVVLVVAVLAVVAAVTVVLNLDTAVVFLTPVALHAARARRMDETVLLYGTVFMCNAASLLLPGSNLTNLLVVGGRGVSGSAFAAAMAPAWTAAVVITMAVVVAWRFRDLGGRGPAPAPDPLVRPRWGVGAVAVVAAAVLVLTLPDPALPVAAVGLGAAALEVRAGRASTRGLVAAVGPAVLLALFAVAVTLGTVARAWDGPRHLLASAGPVATAWVAVGLSCVVNNLPAAVLLSARVPPHPRALLVGLNLGPNLAVTGALSAILWLRVARRHGARPSVRTYSAVGAVVVPLTVTAALAALWVAG